jgi:hypothetical protein
MFGISTGGESKRKRLTEERIVRILKKAETAGNVRDLCLPDGCPHKGNAVFALQGLEMSARIEHRHAHRRQPELASLADGGFDDLLGLG